MAERRAYTIRDQVALRRLEGFVVSPDGSRVILQIGERGSREEPLRHLALVRQRRRDRSAQADPTRQGRSEPGLRARWSQHLSPVGPPQRRAPGRPVVPRRRHAGAGDAARPSTSSRSCCRGTACTWHSPRTCSRAVPTRSRRPPSDSKQERRPATGRIHDQLFVRHWDEWKDGRRRHLFVQRVDGGPAVDVMPEMDADAPSKPFGGTEQYTFTPDGTQLVFTARDAGREEAWSTDLDLFAVPIDAQLTAPQAHDREPRDRHRPVVQPGRDAPGLPRDGSARIRGGQADGHAARAGPMATPAA